MSEPQSRNEAILQATIDGTEYTDPPQSRIEDLLLQLKTVIEGLGGTYADLPDKPSINNHTVVGEMTGADLGLVNSNINMSFTVDSDGILNVVYDDGE